LVLRPRKGPNNDCGDYSASLAEVVDRLAPIPSREDDRFQPVIPFSCWFLSALLVTRPREHRLEAVDLDRLGQMVIESGSERTLAVFIAAVTGQRGKND
jgi:hypothetical protein